MRIKERDYVIEHLLNNTISYDKWQNFAEDCFNTDYVDYINAVLNAKVLFYTKIEEIDYQETTLELISHRSDIINKTHNKSKKVLKRKIHKLA